MNLLNSQHILITDIGSTTTKALLISKDAGGYCFTAITNIGFLSDYLIGWRRTANTGLWECRS